MTQKMEINSCLFYENQGWIEFGTWIEKGEYRKTQMQAATIDRVNMRKCPPWGLVENSTSIYIQKSLNLRAQDKGYEIPENPLVIVLIFQYVKHRFVFLA